MTAPSLNHLKTGLKLAVSLVLLAFSLHLIRLGQLADNLRGARLGPLGISALLLFISGFAGASSWFFILRVRIRHIRFRDVLSVHWTGMFFNTFLPSNVGGDVVKGCLMAQGKNATGFVVASVLLDRLLNLGLLLIIGLFSLLYAMGHRVVASVFLGMTLVSIVAAIRFAQLMLPRLGQGASTGKISRFISPVCELTASPAALLPALLAASVSQSLKIWQNAFVIYAVGLNLPSRYVWFVIPLFGIVSALPISIGGLGVREVVAQFIASPLRLDTTDLVALSLAGHLMVVLINMLGVIPFVFTKRGSSRKSAETVTSKTHRPSSCGS